MAVFNRFRLFHWLLAGFFLAVYLSGDDAELLHVWLGYGLVGLLLARLLIALLRLRGFARLLPAQLRESSLAAVGTWLTFAILVSLTLASVIGLGMVDNGDVLADLPGVGPGVFGAASDLDFVGWLGDAEEVHEFFANLALALVGLHIGYVLFFPRKLAWSLLRGVRQPAPAAASGPASAVPPAAPAFTALEVSARQAETADSASFTLRVPPALHEHFAAQPGQFVTLRVPCGEPPLLRCYSLSQPLAADGTLRITVKRVPGGRASNWLLDHLQPGAHLELLPPAGLFVSPDLDGDHLLLGAGSGITPLRAILEAVLEQGRGRIFLFYASRDAASLIFAEELAALAMRHPERLQLCIWLDAEQGLPNSEAIAVRIAAWPRTEAFVCGPQVFMDSAIQALVEHGLESQRIHLERFAAATPVVAQGDGARASRLQVTLDGRRRELDVQPGEALLEAMEAVGMQPPQACRAGVCGACRCRVVEGQARMRSNGVLDAAQLQQGWVLACQAEPASDRLVVEY